MFGQLLQTLLCVAVASRLAFADDFKYDYDGYNSARYGIYPDNRHKGTNTKTPMLQISTWNKDSVSKSGSHIFLRHNGAQDTWGHQQASPLILNADDLSAVYINRSFPLVFNVRVQQDFGKKYLTFYGDKLVDFGLGSGICHVYDTSYREVYKVAAQNLKVKADLHECELTGHGTAIVSAYETGPSRSPPSLKGKHTSTLIREGIFQEIELETNKVLFTWRASEHVDIYDSYEKHGTPWDFFHINTIEKTVEGNYLVSARHMHSIYLVNGKTGDIMWTMGGKKNEFVELPPPDGVSSSNPVLAFSWQHHSRFYEGSGAKQGGKRDMTFFDNHSNDHSEYGCQANCSRGLHIRLDTESNPKTVQLVREYRHPASLLSQSQGSMQILDNGNVFIGWGRMPSFTEHSSDGDTVLDVQFSPWISPATAGHALDNYRAFKQDWRATPYWPPNVAVKTRAGSTTAYLSWNGATEVKGWVLFASDSQDVTGDPANIVAQVQRSGFETEVPLGNFNTSYLRAEALDKSSRVIGSTGVLDAKKGKFVSMDMALSIELEDIDETESQDDDASVSLNWDFSKEGRKWENILKLFTILGLGLSVSCIAYALTLRSRLGKNAQRYSPL